MVMPSDVPRVRPGSAHADPRQPCHRLIGCFLIALFVSVGLGACGEEEPPTPERERVLRNVAESLKCPSAPARAIECYRANAKRWTCESAPVGDRASATKFDASPSGAITVPC